MKGIFDAANFVHAGVAPFDDGWQRGLAELTDFFHIKDMLPGQTTCCPAGAGKGQILETLADAKKRGFDGYMTIEPHMARGGQFGGFTGPELFGQAVAGIKGICDQVGIKY